MTIRTKLLSSMLIQLLLVLLVSLALAVTLQAQQQATDKNARTSEIYEAITEMRFLAVENQLRHSDRTLEQWQAKYASLTALLSPSPADTPTERQILADMTDQHQAIKPLFDRLIASHTEPVPATATGAAMLASFQERLVGQLLVKQQAEITHASRLAALSRAQIASQQMAQSWIVFGVTVLMLIVTAVNAWVVTRTITSALSSLQQGAAAISAGNLGYRIRRRQADEFGRLAAAFNDMAAGLQQIDRTKAEFIIMASHQLRTPATAVKGLISMLMDGYLGKLSTPQADTLKSAFTENEHQLALIDEMLSVAQAETGELTLIKTSIHLPGLIADIVTAQAPLLQARSQTIHVHTTPNLPQPPADPEQIRVVLENLITNASSYSPPGTDIEVTISHSAFEVTVAIADHGFGIAKADQKKLFKKFSRLNNTGQTRIAGAGLGLYLAKKIIDLHHGRISVSSVVRQGSTFTIHLPLS